MDQGEAGERRPDAVGEPEPGEVPDDYSGDGRTTGEFPLVAAPRMVNGWPVAIGVVSVPVALRRVAAGLESEPVAATTGTAKLSPEPEYAPPKPFAVALVSASSLLLVGACAFALLRSGGSDPASGRAGADRSAGVVVPPLPVALTSPTASAKPSASGGAVPRTVRAPATWAGTNPGGDQSAGNRGGSGQGGSGAVGGSQGGAAAGGGGSTGGGGVGSGGGSTTGPVSGGAPTPGETSPAPDPPSPQPQPTEGSTMVAPSAETPAG